MKAERSLLQLFALAIVLLGASLVQVSAEEKKPDLPKQPPRIIVTTPLALTRGSTRPISIYGLNLTEATAVRAEAGGVALELKIKARDKVELPKNALPEKLGDTRIQIELKIPAAIRAEQFSIIVVTPAGTSEPHLIRLYDVGALLPEKEPNGGFRAAQEIHTPITIAGAIGQENDVDVFRITAKAGQKLTATVWAARVGSPLDSLLTLYDERGQVVLVNDDDESADSKLLLRFPHDGIFYLSVTDALEKGGGMYAYLLNVTLE